MPVTVFISSMVAFALAADKKDEGPLQPIKVVKLDRKEPVTYEKDIEPLLENKCAFCHSGSVKEAKLDMATYESLMKGGKRGAPIVPGKPAESLFLKLSGKTEKPAMPPKDEDPLTPEELALLKLWIEQGAKGPTGAKVAKAGAKLGKLSELVSPVVAVGLSPDKNFVAAGRGNQMHLYETATGSLFRPMVNSDLKDEKGQPLNVAHLDIVQSMAVSPDGSWLASGGYQEVVIWLLKVKPGMMLHQLTGFADRVVALDFSKDGKMLAAGGGAPTQEGEIKVFDVVTGRLIVDIKNGHSDTVFGVRFSPDGSKLATCGADKFVKVFEIPSGKLLKSFEGHTHHVMDVGWKPDGKLLVSAGADNAIKVWDYEKGEQVRTIAGHGKQVTRLQFIGSTSQFATCSGDATVRFWNVDNGGNVRNFSGGSDYLYAVSVSPDGAMVAAGGQDGVVRLYNGANGQLMKELKPTGNVIDASKK